VGKAAALGEDQTDYITPARFINFMHEQRHDALGEIEHRHVGLAQRLD